MYVYTIILHGLYSSLSLSLPHYQPLLDFDLSCVTPHSHPHTPPHPHPYHHLHASSPTAWPSPGTEACCACTHEKYRPSNRRPDSVRTEAAGLMSGQWKGCVLASTSPAVATWVRPDIFFPRCPRWGGRWASQTGLGAARTGSGRGSWCLRRRRLPRRVYPELPRAGLVGSPRGLLPANTSRHVAGQSAAFQAPSSDEKLSGKPCCCTSCVIGFHIIYVIAL